MSLIKHSSSNYSPLNKTPQSVISNSSRSSSSSSSSGSFYNEEIKYFNPYVPSAIFHRRTNSKIDNPYSNSLWYYIRGNDGDEIRKMEERQKTIRALSGNKKTLGRSKSEMNRRTSDKKSILMEASNSLKSKAHSLQRIQPNKSNFTIFKPFSPLDPLFQKERQPLEDLVPSFELENICKASLHHFDLLASLKESLNEYLEQNAILMNQKFKRLLFGNNETMNSVCMIFYQKIIGKQQIDVADMNDYLSRALRVYPSYIFHRSQRKYIVENMTSEKSHKFQNWLMSIGNILLVDGYTSLDEVLVAPVADLQKMIDFLEDNLDTDDPANLGALNKIAKLRGYITSQQHDNLKMVEQIEDELPFFEIPVSWKTHNKQKWREMSKLSVEEQSIAYLRSEIQATLNGFKIWYKQLSIKCLEKIENIIHSNIHIATIFNDMSQNVMSNTSEATGTNCPSRNMTPRTELFYENSVGSTYQMYLNKCEREKQQVSIYLLKFEVSMDSRNKLFTGYVKKILEDVKQSDIRNIVSRMGVITTLSKLLECTKQYEMMAFARFIVTLRTFMATPLIDSSRSISGWHEMKPQEIIGRFESMRKAHKAILRDMYTGQSSVENLSRKIGTSAATERVLDILK